MMASQEFYQLRALCSGINQVNYTVCVVPEETDGDSTTQTTVTSTAAKV